MRFGKEATLRPARGTPLSCGNQPGPPSHTSKRRLGDKYTTSSYRRAIHRACDKAFAHPDFPRTSKSKLSTEDQLALESWQRAHRWIPNQLRHTAATEIRQLFGLEAPQVSLGHSAANVTQVYCKLISLSWLRRGRLHKAIELWIPALARTTDCWRVGCRPRDHPAIRAAPLNFLAVNSGVSAADGTSERHRRAGSKPDCRDRAAAVEMARRAARGSISPGAVVHPSNLLRIVQPIADSALAKVNQRVGLSARASCKNWR